MHTYNAESAMDQLPGLKGTFSTILVDPRWQFQNCNGKGA
jgi:hypothetical protein